MAYINKKDSNGTKPLLQEGELGYDNYTSGGDVGRVYIGTGTENIAFSQKQELDNVISGTTDITYDNTTSGLTATTIKTALDEIQASVEAQNEAIEITYDNTNSGLVATNVKTAIDEVVTGDISVSGIKTFEGDVTFNANVYMAGSVTEVNSISVSTSDNIIVLNDGEVGTGVTAGEAGIYVDRGLSTNYGIIFDETDDAFKIGEVGSYQKVATREDTPTDVGYAYWDAATSKFLTTVTPDFTSLTLGGVNVLTQTEVESRDSIVENNAIAFAIALG